MAWISKAKLADIETRLIDLERQIKEQRERNYLYKPELFSRGVPSVWGDGYIKGTEITVIKVLMDLLKHLGLKYEYVSRPPSGQELVKITKKGAKNGV